MKKLGLGRWLVLTGAVGMIAVACSSGSGGGGSGGGGSPLGGACEEDDDCASNPRGRVLCDDDFFSDEPQPFCQLLAPQPAGEACSGDIEKHGYSLWNAGSELEVPVCDNEVGLYCTNQVCTAPAKLGEACQGLCVAGAFCQNSLCVPLAEVGEECSGFDTCVDTAYCDWTDDRCKARRGIGEACGMNSECTSDYCWEDECQEWSW